MPYMAVIMARKTLRLWAMRLTTSLMIMHSTILWPAECQAIEPRFKSYFVSNKYYTLSLFSVENQALILLIYRRDNGCLPMRYKEILSDVLYFRMELNHTPAHCNIHIYQPVEALITPGILVSDFIGPHVHILHAQDGLFICYRVLFLLFRVHIFRCSRTITRTVS